MYHIYFRPREITPNNKIDRVQPKQQNIIYYMYTMYSDRCSSVSLKYRAFMSIHSSIHIQVYLYQQGTTHADIIIMW